ncbi:GNAT family N-acetyltransferase [Nemorincola caseinilytica]|uniref:GNAT family N-acetyltransferase n=1 Tax=Nemorincola caseinilytica TaxID=2054315 RepID=A0ABP8NRL7_9BACT
MDNIEYHLATEADVDIILRYRIKFGEELASTQVAADEATLRESLTEYFAREVNRNYICWYATHEGVVVSIAGLVVRVGPGNIKNPSGRWGYVMNVYTLPQYRGRGLSSAIMDRLLATGVERGITAFELHSTPAGEPVYIKAGFKLHNEPTYRKFITHTR